MIKKCLVSVQAVTFSMKSGINLEYVRDERNILEHNRTWLTRTRHHKKSENLKSHEEQRFKVMFNDAFISSLIRQPHEKRGGDRTDTLGKLLS